MKILILSCGTGGGHNSAAFAIKEELDRRNINNEFRDYYSIINKNPVYALNRLSKKKLYRYITENEFDYVITTHINRYKKGIYCTYRK